jgi:hypothetical protein
LLDEAGIGVILLGFEGLSGRPGATAIKRGALNRSPLSSLIVPAINNNGNMRILLRG